MNLHMLSNIYLRLAMQEIACSKMSYEGNGLDKSNFIRKIEEQIYMTLIYSNHKFMTPHYILQLEWSLLTTALIGDGKQERGSFLFSP